MSYGTYFWINGGHESAGRKKTTRRGGEEKEQEEDEEEEMEEIARARERAVREEFETLAMVAEKRGGEREREGGARAAARLRETESASAYNLKTYSAFKLLTMAAGYKVLCRCRGTGWRRGGGVWGRAVKGRTRFKSLIYLRGDCGRHDGGQIGGRF